MKRVRRFVCLTACWLVWTATLTSRAETFYFIGPSGGDFFNELNWNTLPTGGGSSPQAGSIEPDVGFVHHLILDGDTVEANGREGDEAGIDVGSGGWLEVQTGSTLSVVNDFFNAQFELSTGGTLTFTDSILTVQDDIVFRGASSFSGGTIESFFDDIEFRSSELIVTGTTFRTTDVSSGASSNLWVQAELTPQAGAMISGATFFSNSRFGIDQFNMVAVDSVFEIAGDLEDLTTTDLDSATATLFLFGESVFTAGQVQEGVKLELNDSSIATFTNVPGTQEVTHTWFTNSSTVTLNSPDAQLILENPQLVSGAPKVINGVTGKSYAEDPNTWDPTDWDGVAAVTLQITSQFADPDFNGDNKIDGTDFLIWQRGLGLTGQPDNTTGDATGDGLVNFADLAAWEVSYGQQSATLAAVPEPESALIAVVTLVTLAMGRQTQLRAFESPETGPAKE